MIRDLSQTLRAMLDDPALAASFPELAAAQVVFDRPTEQFNPSQTTVDLFLYDVRENVELRHNEPVIERRDGQAEIRRPAMRVSCSYLVTVWPVGGSEAALQEHRLLSQVLQVLSRHTTVPTSFLQGRLRELVDTEPPMPMTITPTEGFKNPVEFWTAVGNKLRPSLTLTVTISLKDLAPPERAPLVKSKTINITDTARAENVPPETPAANTAPGVTEPTPPPPTTAATTVTTPTPTTTPTTTPAPAEPLFNISGRVTNAAGAPQPDATVTLVKLKLTETTDANGMYGFKGVPASTYRVNVQAGLSKRTVNLTVPAPAGKNYDVQLP